MVIVDEYSQADSAALKNVLTSSMGARLNPLTVVITTASDKETAPFVEMLKMYKAILRGEIENDSIFAHIFEPDIDDEEGDPATWRKVQPHMGITVYEDFYIDAYQRLYTVRRTHWSFGRSYLMCLQLIRQRNGSRRSRSKNDSKVLE